MSQDSGLHSAVTTLVRTVVVVVVVVLVAVSVSTVYQWYAIKDPGLTLQEVHTAVDEYLASLNPGGVRAQLDIFSRQEVQTLLNRQRTALLSYVQRLVR